jgi:hypothetical protein
MYGDVCPSGYTCGGDCRCHPSQPQPSETCTISVNDIYLEEFSAPIDPESFCLGDTLRARASVDLRGYVDPVATFKLFIDGSLVDTESVNMHYGSTTVNFDSSIQTSSLGTGSHTIKVTASVYCDPDGGQRTESFYISDCRPRVCTPGETRNRYCACSTQVAYERCKADGSGWDTVIENCPSGQKCDSGYCAFVPACTEKYLDEYRCSDNWKQKKYQNSDCSTTWVFYEYCSYGCSGGECLPPPPTPTCTPKYLDNFRCSGDWRQREYIYSDCSTGWIDWEYCSGYCSGGVCYYEEACRITVDVSTPADARVGDVVTARVTVQNSGDRGGYVNLDAYVCQTDPACYRMSCDGYGGDPRVYVYGHDSYTLTCSAQMNEKSTHEVKVVWSGCGDGGTVYSGRFEVREPARPKCAAQFLSEYRCSGDWKQRMYQYSDCSTAWVSLERCECGCSAGTCLPKPITTTTTLPTVTTTTLPPKAELTGWAALVGVLSSPWSLVVLLLVILLVLLFLIYRRECVCYRTVWRGNRPEWFETS